MKRSTFFHKIILLCLFSSPLKGADIIYSNYSGDFGAADYLEPEVSVIISGGAGQVTDFGSTDQTVGSKYLSTIPIEGGAHQVTIINNQNVITLVMANESDSPIILEELNFDYLRAFSSSPRDITVEYVSNDTGTSVVLDTFTNTNPGDSTTKISDFDDYSVSLSDLSPITSLDSAAFTITFSNAGSDSVAGILDNIGVTGFFREVDITVNAGAPSWTISKELNAMHQVYTLARDERISDGSVAEWVKKVGISGSRFPGGTVVKYWGWDDPTGYLSKNDKWDPDWDPADQVDGSEWMSLDEYLAFITEAEIAPILGVNLMSGVYYDREQDGIDRAAAMVQYVKDQGFEDVWYYLGNEEEHLHGGVAAYAKTFAKYATAMKAVDPNIKAFWNTNDLDSDAIEDFLANDGGTSDGVETHGKWPYGGTPEGYDPGTYEEWLTEFPLRDRKNSNRAWRFAGDNYRRIAEENGREDYLVLNLEWGAGSNSNMLNFSKYTLNLMFIEFAMELYVGNWDASAFWDSMLAKDTGMFDFSYNNFNSEYKINPIAHGMNFLGDSLGGEYIQVDTGDNRIHGFAAMKNGAVILYLINKYETASDVNIAIDGLDLSAASARCIIENPDDGYGMIVTHPVSGDGQSFQSSLPALSFTEVTFTTADTVIAATSVALVAEGLLEIKWQTLPAWRHVLESSVDLTDWKIENESIFSDNTIMETLLPVSPNEEIKKFWRMSVYPAE